MESDPQQPWLSLDRRVIEVDYIVGGIVTCSVALAALLGLLVLWLLARSADWAVWAAIPVAIVIVAVVAGISFTWPPLDYRHTAYRVLPDRIEIRQGVVWRTLKAVPRVRVQHVDVAQGPLERRYGLATLSIYTAGTEYSQVSLRGLEYWSALTMRDRLLPADSPDAV